MKKFTVKTTNEMMNYLQRLGFEVAGRLTVIEHLFEMHKNDKDTSLFDSVPWKKYYGEYEEINNEYELAKSRFGKEVVSGLIEKELGHTVENYNWNIDDFQSGEIEIEIIE